MVHAAQPLHVPLQLQMWLTLRNKYTHANTQSTEQWERCKRLMACCKRVSVRARDEATHYYDSDLTVRWLPRSHSTSLTYLKR